MHLCASVHGSKITIVKVETAPCLSLNYIYMYMVCTNKCMRRNKVLILATKRTTLGNILLRQISQRQKYRHCI